MYLNGKPFDIGMTNPVQILQSIQANKVKKIEIVTEPDFRFSNKIPVINIITFSNSLDGIYFNGAIKYEAVPNANVGTSFLAKKEHIVFSFSYNYGYQSQRNQPISQSITTNDNSTIIEGKGNGNWHTHILRALTSWRMDSLNVIYADFHAKINNDNYNPKWFEQHENTIRTEDVYLKNEPKFSNKRHLGNEHYLQKLFPA